VLRQAKGQVADHAYPQRNKSVIRIKSVEQLPERVVIDTSLPTVVSPQCGPLNTYSTWPTVVTAELFCASQALLGQCLNTLKENL
jgi:hypothetical protein